MAKIRCLPDLKDVEISETELILEALRDADIPITYVCGGNAQCSTCRVMVVEGLEHCTPVTSREQALIKNLGFPGNIRLACQTGVVDDVTVKRLVIDNEDINIVEGQLSHGSIGAEKLAAVLFVAIRGGADFDETKFPYDIIYTMSRYFHRMNQVVTEYGGKIVSYMGNRLVAIFDGEMGEQEAMVRSAWASLEMLQAVAEINRHFATLSYQPLSLSMGLHYGSVLSVAIANDAPDVVIGNTLIMANRIESTNRELGTSLLISEQIYQGLSDRAVVGQQTALKLPARLGEMRVYQLTGISGAAPTKIEVKQGLSNFMLSLVKKFSSGWGKKR